jgi:hypothetical protein
MSKGFGSVQRKIAEVLDENPNDAFRVDELCRRIYGWDYVHPEKKQRVSVIRAAKALLQKRADLGVVGYGGPGYGLAFFHQGNVMSYGRAMLKHRGYSVDCISQHLVSGGFYHKAISEGGTWWNHVQKWIDVRRFL